MNQQELLQMQAIELKLAQVLAAISSKDMEGSQAQVARELPEWIGLEQAAEMKGAAAVSTYKTRKWLQPCCGLRSRRVGGRMAWPRDLVVEWLGVTDEGLYGYAQKFGAKVPDKFKRIKE